MNNRSCVLVVSRQHHCPICWFWLAWLAWAAHDVVCNNPKIWTEKQHRGAEEWHFVYWPHVANQYMFKSIITLNGESRQSYVTPSRPKEMRGSMLLATGKRTRQ